MLLTPRQVKRFWREWAACIRLHKWSATEAEPRRKAMLARAGFTSLTNVDKLGGFDLVLAEIKALSEPSDLEAQLRHQNMPRRRLIFSCRQKADEPYIIALARDRFHTDDWPAMPLDRMEQLRNTLADRAVQEHRAETIVARRHSNRQRRVICLPDVRQTFPDLPSGICNAPAPEPEYAAENAPF